LSFIWEKEIQLGPDPAIIGAPSESGWTTTDTFQQYLELILDCYSVHRSPEIKRYAERLRKRLWFIPAGRSEALHLWIERSSESSKPSFIADSKNSAGSHGITAMDILREI
jgi:hypothetical protein